VSDNASNNDTMMVALEARFAQHNIPFSAAHARIRCLPHIIDLAATKVRAVSRFVFLLEMLILYQILTTLDLTTEEEIEAANANYQDTLNSVQVALDDPDSEDADLDELELLQHSSGYISARSKIGPLQRVASAIYRVSFNILFESLVVSELPSSFE
jgi:hypothetical protein